MKGDRDELTGPCIGQAQVEQVAGQWFAGDTHVHFLSSQGAQLEARGEDVNVVNLLLSQWGHLFTNSEDWIGRPTVAEDGKTIVLDGEVNENIPKGIRSRVTYKILNDNEFTETYEIAEPGKDLAVYYTKDFKRRKQ